MNYLCYVCIYVPISLQKWFLSIFVNLSLGEHYMTLLFKGSRPILYGFVATVHEGAGEQEVSNETLHSWF